MQAAGSLVALTGVVTLAFAAGTFEPARLRSGSAPQPPPQTIGWLDAVLHAHVTPAGTVEKVDTVRASEPLRSLLHDHVTRWRFAPARRDGVPVSAQVLVVAIYRPATLFNHAEAGDLPSIVFDRSSPAPSPVSTPLPGYPPRAAGDGVVVVEMRVTAEGTVTAARVVRSAGTAFDSTALQHARRWRFSPASSSAPRPTLAYVIFGFRQPVVTPR
jgi:TonB family protein